MSTELSTKTTTRTRKSTTISIPRLWKVIILNDDKTPMDFVIELLMTMYKHTLEESTAITMQIHINGSAVAGVYSHEIAEQKYVDSIQMSRAAGHPLQFKIEKEKA